MTNENTKTDQASRSDKPANSPGKTASGRDKSIERQERAAQALRDNLRRRKQQKKNSDS
jgi:hypothetical protein